jgi:PAS domain S-box-containing protein
VDAAALLAELIAANETLRAREAHLASIFAGAAVGLSEIAPDGRFLAVNDELCRIMGRSRAEMLGLGVMDVTHPDDVPASLAAAAAVLSTGRPSSVDKRYLRPDGGVVWANSSLSRVTPAGGKPRLLAVTADLTGRRETEARLAESERRLGTLVEGMPQLVWRSAGGGRWTWCSRQWTDYTGLGIERSQGLGWREALHPADRSAAEAAWQAADTDGVLQFDCRIRHAGSHRLGWFQTRAVPVRDATGQILEWIGTCTNIDEQVHAREVLARSRDELERLVDERTGELMAAEETLRQAQKMEAIGQLTGGIAHDFNNMLQGVSGGLDMARRRMAAGRLEEAARYLDAARDATGRAAGLTRRLLAFARRQELDPRPVELPALVRGMADMIRRTMGPGIALDLDLDGAEGCVLCDPNELESALLNLCINARDAMPGGGRLVIGTRAVAPPGATPQIELRVEDTGTGMTPELLRRVTEPFFTTKPTGEGTGLGLAQVEAFARQSGGALHIQSSPGAGTVVRLSLPSQPRPDAKAAPPSRAPAPSAELAASQTVLLVDDETGVRGPAAERLRDIGYRVVEAADGPTALARVEEGLRPDLLVTDVGLPGGMDGARLAQALRQRLPRLPVLFTTGYASPPVPPGSEVVPKPFGLDHLTERVGQALGRRA